MIFSSKYLAFCLGASLAPSFVASESCKCTPNTPCFPTTAEWASLNDSVHGALIASKPLASVCYVSSEWDDYDEASCDTVRSQWTVDSLHAADPISIDYPIWANNSCDPINEDGVSVTGDPHAGAKGCSLGAGGGGKGIGGGYPYYAVNATSAKQVSAALKWAAEKNVRVVIKNTGHNVPGRSTGWGSLSIWTHNMKSYKFHESWKPKDCPSSPGQMAVTVGAGIQDFELYELTNKSGAIAVGGSEPGVGVVGWMLGGGHGPLSATYGMGADNLLQAKVVLASGKVVVANEHKHTDLYWALRGGGGGTFGVVVEATVKAFPTPKARLLSMTIVQQTVNSSTTTWFYDLMGDMHHEFADWKAAGFQGYYGIIGPPITGGLTFWGAFYLYDTPLADSQATFAPYKAKLDEAKAQGWLNYGMTWGEEKPSFFDMWSPPVSEGVAQSGFAMGSRLLKNESLADVDTIRQTIQYVGPKAENITSISNPQIYGHLIANSANRGLDVALNPAWRDTVTHFIVVVPWQDGSPQPVIEAVYDDMANDKVEALKKISPDSGAYFNECDAFEPDWQQSFFGKNYPRLLAIKQKYDPKGLFWCRSCVGSEAWAEGDDGKLCKVSET